MHTYCVIRFWVFNSVLYIREKTCSANSDIVFSMCDFSEYGFPSKEWLQLEVNLPTVEAGQEQSVAELKQVTNLRRDQVSQSEMLELKTKVSMKDFSVPTRDGQDLEARTYRSSVFAQDESLPIYIHFHGGGFLFGTLQSEDAICSRIALATGAMVLNVNYRHTPEYTYPTAWNDAEDTLIWLCKPDHNKINRINGDLSQLVIGGVSAGAYIAAALVQTVLRGELNASTTPKICGQVLMIPCLVSTACYDSQLKQIKEPSVSSYCQAANAPILNMARKNFFNSLLKVANPDPQDRRLNPAHVSAEVVKRLPPTTMGIAGYDPLRDEGLLYGKLLSENG